MNVQSELSSKPNSQTGLPLGGRQRWLAGKKAKVLDAIQTGTLSLEEACKRYFLTAEEVQSWHASFAADGLPGLKMKRLAERRMTARRKVSEPAAALLDSGDRLQCTITDVGRHGARLEFGVRLPVPRTFKLLCAKSSRSLPVCVKWQREQLAGVQFEAAESDELKGVDDLSSWLLGEG